MKYHLTTLGCQMNVHDSEKIAGILEALGYRRAESEDDADLILFNTCSVRENPERKVLGRLSALRTRKRANPGLIVGVCGCMVQVPAHRSRLEEDYPQVDLVFGTHNLHELPAYLERVRQGERVIEVWDEGREPVEGVPVRRTDPFHAWVDITYGCDNACAYCIVPTTRGRCRSRQPERIVAEVERVVGEGVREVTLLGQNVNAYGKDLEGAPDFAGLLWRINEVEGLWRIRFTTSHPKDVSDRLIDALAEAEKVCEHLHLPLQSGSTAVLRRMNRGYSAEDYLRLVDRLRDRVPEIALTTDLIVGFPGETEEEFRETLEVVGSVKFDAAFTFVYSPRPGTPAAALPGQVGAEAKRDRIARLIALQEQCSAERNRQLAGRRVEVLVEGASKTDPARLAGRTRTNKLVHFPGPPELAGTLVQVQVDETHPWTLYGRLIGQERSDGD
ncbi:MAG: tRNA (N6-isopentenyl adenosine(37)-C2)-methylthiotransferase MiaB [Bacillota bacterium]|nr:tRNA (N6-isopentenyl adenosine(37)-C2)-methylthiotransferase MiaB [Bacillota bacterium]